MNLSHEGLRLLAASPVAHHPEGHSHFWDRALSRRQFLATTGLAGGAVVTSSIWMPLLAEASSSAAPTPIPYGTTVEIKPLGLGPKLFHFLPPKTDLDQSTIFNFKGTVGVAEISGPGVATHNGAPIAGTTFGSDNRFMKGTYIGTDGERHRGTFAFI
jgi:hypothetical protein